MLFALICDDRPDAGSLRADTRPAHLDFLKELGTTLRFAGPFMDEAGAPNGSLVVVEAEDAAAARALADRDPYAVAGLFSRVTVRPWRWVVNNPAAA